MKTLTVVVPVVASLLVAPLSPGGSDARILVATGTFAGDGTLVAMERATPWNVVTVATLDSMDAAVQSFNGLIFVVEPDTDRVRVFDGTLAEIRSFSVGEGTRPRDILGVARNRAYVTRANSTHLYRVDPQTGVGADVVDLSGLAGHDGIPDMERMATDGSRLFVQLRRFADGLPTADGALAVIDLETETLIDAVPATPEIDAIELTGPAPRLRMHVDPGAAFLLVSATDGNHLSLGGGIEFIDLASLSSAGLLLNEMELAALGGFAMTGPAEGYFVFHTDIVPSNHLQTFTIPGGAELGPEIVFDFGAYLDALLFDSDTSLLYMPSAAPGMYVVDTTTETALTKEPIPLPAFPFDQTIGPVGHRYDLTGDDVVDFVDLLTLIAAWGACPTPCPPTCVADIAAAGGPGADCVVDFGDLLLLLANWGS
ncbi:MAG: hypothetical protein KJO43_06705 [Phycisphaerae bacterium]|nr:hypothetical protein [Phycisphaerae bacterium]